MKKSIAFFLVITCIIVMTGCTKKTDTISFHDQVFNRADLSKETVEWLERYNNLPKGEQLLIDFIPAEVYDALYDFHEAEDIDAIACE